jgi:phosphate transporter
MLLACIAGFIMLLVVPIVEVPVQQNYLTIVIFIDLLWANEICISSVPPNIMLTYPGNPLFVISLPLPFLAITLNVVRSDTAPHKFLESKAVASYVFSAMWSPVIMLLLGGFTIAAALSKYNIVKMMATIVPSEVGTKPRTVLLINMFVTMFASMLISQVAARYSASPSFSPSCVTSPPTPI